MDNSNDSLLNLSTTILTPTRRFRVKMIISAYTFNNKKGIMMSFLFARLVMSLHVFQQQKKRTL